ncbi:hypothetical protein Hte_012029 [Hypoxylon texense]
MSEYPLPAAKPLVVGDGLYGSDIQRSQLPSILPRTKVKIDNAHLKACNDSNFWCCESDANILTTQQCCNQAFKLTQPVGTVIAQLQSGIGAIPLATAAASAVSSSSPSSSPSISSSPDTSNSIPAGAIAGLAVEGVILAVTLAALAFVLWRNRLLTKKANEAEAAAVAAKSAQEQQMQQMQQYHWQPPPSSQGGTISQVGPYGYGSPVETEPPKRSELHSELGYPELPGEPIGTELSSDPRTPRSPNSPSSPFGQS